MYGYEYQILFGGRVPEDIDKVMSDLTEVPIDENGNPTGPTSDGRSFLGPLDGISSLMAAS